MIVPWVFLCWQPQDELLGNALRVPDQVCQHFLLSNPGYRNIITDLDTTLMICAMVIELGDLLSSSASERVTCMTSWSLEIARRNRHDSYIVWSELTCRVREVRFREETGGGGGNFELVGGFVAKKWGNLSRNAARKQIPQNTAS